MRRVIGILTLGLVVTSATAVYGISRSITLDRRIGVVKSQLLETQRELAGWRDRATSNESQLTALAQKMASIESQNTRLKNSNAKLLFGNVRDAVDAQYWRTLQSLMPVTAICRDRTFSYSQHASGTCSYHGGVALWIHHPTS